MGLNPCCCMSRSNGASLAASFAIGISILKLVRVTLDLVIIITSYQQDVNATKEFRDLEFADLELSDFYIMMMMVVELLLNVVHIIFSLLLIVHGVKKERLCPVNTFLIFGTLFFVLSLCATCVNYFLGMEPIEVYTYDFIALFANLYIIYVVYIAYVEVIDSCSTSVTYDATIPSSFEGAQNSTSQNATCSLNAVVILMPNK